MAYNSGSLTETGSVALVKPREHTHVHVGISGTYGTVTFVIEGRISGENWAALQATSMATGLTSTGTISPSDNTEAVYRVPADGLVGVRVRATAVGSGTFEVQLQSGSYLGTPSPTTTSLSGMTFGASTYSGDVLLSDSVKLKLGTGEDITVAWDGTDLDVLQAAANSSIKWGVDGAGIDQVFYCDTASSNITFDQSADALVFTAANIASDTSTGMKIGTSTSQKVGFFNATPVAQRSAYTQTYSTADKTHANLTSATLTDNTSGTANTTLQALADGTTWANDVAAVRNNFADLAASNNAIIADLTDLKQLVNSVIDDLQALGLVA